MAEEINLEHSPDRFIAVDKHNFELRLYTRAEDQLEFRPARIYPIAIGAKGFATPPNVYLINEKAKNPSWQAPYSDWVEEDFQGTIVDGDDPDNPIKSRWIGVTPPEEGVGIHGTADDDSIGTRASHGCIRMHVKDVKDLYDRVPIGTLCYIHN